MEVGRDRLEFAVAPTWGLAEPHLVERLDGQLVDDALGRDQRRHDGDLVGDVAERIVRCSRIEVVGAGMGTVRQDAAPDPAAGRQQVEPRHRIPEVGFARHHLGHHVVERVEPVRVDRDAARLDREQPERDLEHEAGEAHAADGGPEQLRIAIGSDVDDGRVGQHHPDVGDVVAERSVEVVVLAVDVARDGAADRHVAGTRRDGDEEPEWDEDPQQVVEADAGADGCRAGLLVDDDRSGRQPEDVAAAVLGRVAVRPTETASDAAAGGEILDRRCCTLVVDVDDDRTGRVGQTETGQFDPPRFGLLANSHRS